MRRLHTDIIPIKSVWNSYRYHTDIIPISYRYHTGLYHTYRITWVWRLIFIPINPDVIPVKSVWTYIGMKSVWRTLHLCEIYVFLSMKIHRYEIGMKTTSYRLNRYEAVFIPIKSVCYRYEAARFTPNGINTGWGSGSDQINHEFIPIESVWHRNEIGMKSVWNRYETLY